MPIKHTQKINLSTYTVNKDLIQSIENYYNSKIPQIFRIEKPLRENISVTIQLTKSITELKSILEYNRKIFPNDVKAIIIELEYVNKVAFYGPVVMLIKTHFTQSNENSFLEITLFDDTPLETSKSIETGILEIMKDYKNADRFIYPREYILFPMLIIGILIGTFGLFSGIKETRLICISFLALDVSYLTVFKYFKSYSSFDSIRQKQIDRIIKWFFAGIAGFILSSTLTPLRKMVFGF